MNTQPEADDIAQVEPIAQYDTNGTRLTCLTIAEDTLPGTVPVKEKEGEEDEESEDEETIFAKVGEGEDKDPEDALDDSD
jgi:protein MAK11